MPFADAKRVPVNTFDESSNQDCTAFVPVEELELESKTCHDPIGVPKILFFTGDVDVTNAEIMHEEGTFADV